MIRLNNKMTLAITEKDEYNASDEDGKLMVIGTKMVTIVIIMIEIVMKGRMIMIKLTSLLV